MATPKHTPPPATSTLVSVDPGKYQSGVAVWADGALLWAGLAVPAETATDAQRWVEMGRVVRDIVEAHAPKGTATRTLLLETMQVYARDGASKAVALLDLMAVDGAVAMALSDMGYDITGVLPAKWKGSVPRDVLSERERAKWEAGDARIQLPKEKKTQADVWAAVSLGRYYWTNLGIPVK